jgi:hypothetical protein
MKKIYISNLILISALVLSGCSSSSSESTASEQETQAEDTVEQAPTLPPKDQFIKVLNENFDSRLDYWSTAVGVNDQALSKFITGITVESDPDFSIVTVTANAEIGGENADLGMGSLVGTQMDNVNGMQAAVFCAGKTYPSDDDTFNNFVKHIAIDFEINDDMATLEFPSKGIIVKMAWSKATITVDKFGAENKKLSKIGVDQVGISTANFEKISDAFSANYRKLSDIAKVTYAKKSWHDGLCAIGQSQNN